MAELEIDNSDEIVRKVKKFMRETCGCALGLNGRPCSDQFTEETVLYNLNNCLELSCAELDLVILANIQVFTKREKVGDKRSRSPRCSFIYQTSPICKEMFLHLYGIDYSRFRRLKEHYQEHRIFPRIHGNIKCMPGNATSEKSLEAIHAFIENYVEENAIVLPGRIPGFKSEEIRLLSSSETKMSVWKEYEGTCKTSNEKAVSYRKFLQLWDEFYPDVVVAKPMTDLRNSKQSKGSGGDAESGEAKASLRSKTFAFFFSKEELSMRNTDGTHGKQSLDKNKLNSLKALVFAKFPVESSEEKEKIWRAIKGKINTRCRVSKLMVIRAS